MIIDYVKVGSFFEIRDRLKVWTDIFDFFFSRFVLNFIRKGSADVDKTKHHVWKEKSQEIQRFICFKE